MLARTALAISMVERSEAELAAWMNSAEYQRRAVLIEWLYANGQMPAIERVAILLDLPLDLALGVVRRALDPEGYAAFCARTRQ